MHIRLSIDLKELLTDLCMLCIQSSQVLNTLANGQHLDVTVEYIRYVNLIPILQNPCPTKPIDGRGQNLRE